MAEMDLRTQIGNKRHFFPISPIIWKPFIWDKSQRVQAKIVLHGQSYSTPEFSPSLGVLVVI
jgi:hypothetical protein